MHIKESLLENNTWWQSSQMDFKFLLEKQRKEFKAILKKIDEKRILSIIGPRRVGKSTLIYQTIHYLLETRKVEPKRILFFSGDDPSLFFSKNDRLSDILEIYFDEILEENIAKLSSKVYIFIDEVHFIKNWQKFLKVYFDRKYNIKFIITGSSSLHLFKDSNESLLGRIENIYVLPLTFNQFLNFHRTYISKTHDLTIPKFNLDEPETSFKNLEIFYYNKDLKLDILKVLKEYMLAGGYPEYFEIRDIDLWQRRLVDDIISRGIYKDILTIYPIQNPEILEKLMYFIADNNSQTFSYSGMTKNFSIDTVTLMNYIAYLKQAFLVNVLENYSTNVGKIIRSNKKLSILDNGIQNALLKKKSLSDDAIGHIMEGVVDFDIRLLCEKENYGQYYYRNSAKEEIDIVLDRKIDVIPIEIKYTNQIENADTKAIQKFIEKYRNSAIGKTKYGIVVTKDVYKKENDLYFVPYWLLNL